MQIDTMIASSLPFAPVSWWAMALAADKVVIDLAEHYQKMSYRNRYYLAAPEGKTMMSLPLRKGRNQRCPVAEVQIANETDWQGQHWKTITSLYGRSPFFEYFTHLLEPVFGQKFDYLHEWNMASANFVKQALNLKTVFATTNNYQPQYGTEVCDAREIFRPQNESPVIQLPEYYQVFSDRCGFQQDCSILDLIFCEGNYATQLLSQGQFQQVL